MRGPTIAGTHGDLPGWPRHLSSRGRVAERRAGIAQGPQTRIHGPRLVPRTVRGQGQTRALVAPRVGTLGRERLQRSLEEVSRPVCEGCRQTPGFRGCSCAGGSSAGTFAEAFSRDPALAGQHIVSVEVQLPGRGLGKPRLCRCRQRPDRIRFGGFLSGRERHPRVSRWQGYVLGVGGRFDP